MGLDLGIGHMTLDRSHGPLRKIPHKINGPIRCREVDFRTRWITAHCDDQCQFQ